MDRLWWDSKAKGVHAVDNSIAGTYLETFRKPTDHSYQCRNVVGLYAMK